MAHSSLISPCITKLTCIVPPPTYASRKYTPAATHGAGIVIRSSSLYCQPLRGARWHFRSCLPPVPYGGSPPALRADKCAARLSFFLPQALLPAGSRFLVPLHVQFYKIDFMDNIFKKLEGSFLLIKNIIPYLELLRQCLLYYLVHSYIA
jgi:hypothetical protein